MSHDGEGPSTEDAGADAPETEDGSGAPESRLMIVDASDLDSVPLAGSAPDAGVGGADGSGKTAEDESKPATEANGDTKPSATKVEGTANNPTVDKDTAGDKAEDTAEDKAKDKATVDDKNKATAEDKDDSTPAPADEAAIDRESADRATTGGDKADADGATRNKDTANVKDTANIKDTGNVKDTAKPGDKASSKGKADAKTKKKANVKDTANVKNTLKPGDKTTNKGNAEADKGADDKTKATPGDGDAADEAKGDAKPGSGVATAKPTVDPSPTATIPVVQAGKTGSGSRRGLKVALVVAGTLVGAYLILAAAWAFDLARHNDAAMRGLLFTDRPVGGMVRAEMEEVVDELTDELGAQPLTISVGDVEIETDPVSVGVRIDDGRMIDQALRARRGGSLFLRPLRWLGHLFSEQVIDPIYVVDAEAATDASQQVVRAELAQPVEPEFDIRGADLVVTPGEEGVRIEPRELVGRLPVTIADGAPFRLELAEEPAVPKLDTGDLEAIAAEVNTQTDQPVTVQVLDDQVQVSPRMMKTWVRLDLGDTDTDTDTAEQEDETEGESESEGEGDDPTVGWRLDEEAVLADLKPLFPTLGSEDQQARFSVVDDEPIIIPAAETVICCDEGTGDRMERAIREPIPVAEESDEEEAASDDEEPALRIARLSPIVTDFDEGVAELEDLGIVELVSTFETKHACCQNRVKNIQRFADLMQGVVIRPDETFSLNEHVGQRTRDKGFFADGAIAQGVIEPQVGGGISQYATTFFNASFFAGLEFVEYQSHSIYISRYPRGREATISWRRPDLEVKNNTPYGILVWNEYTPTSIKVSFYSTKHLDVQALDLRRSSDRQCRIDITPRVITYPDGTQIEDSVFALYRPGEGFDCNGNSTRPPEDEDE